TEGAPDHASSEPSILPWGREVLGKEHCLAPWRSTFMAEVIPRYLTAAASHSFSCAYKRAPRSPYDVRADPLGSLEDFRAMLDDMPDTASTSLVADQSDATDAVAPPPATRKRVAPSAWLRGARRVRVVKESALGVLLKPIGISVALVLSA